MILMKPSKSEPEFASMKKLSACGMFRQADMKQADKILRQSIISGKHNIFGSTGSTLDAKMILKNGL